MNKIIKCIIVLLTLSGCQFAPTFNPTVNEKLADVYINANTIANNCSRVTPTQIFNLLKLPTLQIIEMTKYTTTSKPVYNSSHDLLKEINGFVSIVRANSKTGLPINTVYCKDKMNIIKLTVTAIIKP